MDKLATNEEIEQGLKQLPEWQVRKMDGMQRLIRQFKFNNFKQALNFTNQVGDLAEQNNHHPLIITEWGKVTVEWWSHQAGGITSADLQMAAQTDQLAA